MKIKLTGDGWDDTSNGPRSGTHHEVQSGPYRDGAVIIRHNGQSWSAWPEGSERGEVWGYVLAPDRVEPAETALSDAEIATIRDALLEQVGFLDALLRRELLSTLAPYVIGFERGRKARGE